MVDERIQLKNPIVAGVLAYLVPGSGHFYQGRYFKGTLYFVCILGTFLTGLAMGEGKVVYLRMQPGQQKSWGYLSQVFAGLPALPAFFQAKRYAAIDPDLKTDGNDKLPMLNESLSTTFSGRLRRKLDNGESIEGAVDGTIELTPSGRGHNATGVFRGVFDGRERIEVPLAAPISIGPKVIAAEDVSPRFLGDGGQRREAVFSGTRRYLMCQIPDQPDGDSTAGLIEGTVPRSFFNWFQVPLEDPAEQDLHGRLGKRYELAAVFTWIAGLLNVLAFWDAISGPAYGYGDETQQDEKASANKQKTRQETRPESAPTAPSAAEPTAAQQEAVVTTQARADANPSPPSDD